MPTVIGIANSDFDPEAYARLCQENSGPGVITTQEVLDGLREVESDMFDPEYVAMVKASPMFIASKG